VVRRPSIPNEINACLVAPLERLGGLDSWDILHKSNDAIQALSDAQAQIGGMRRAAVRDLRGQGYTLQEIADQLGVKAQRIHQLEHGYDRAEKRERANKARG
jgi:DNA-directed RNA polymerase specialized sigma24 family protein